MEFKLLSKMTTNDRGYVMLAMMKDFFQFEPKITAESIQRSFLRKDLGLFMGTGDFTSTQLKMFWKMIALDDGWTMLDVAQVQSNIHKAPLVLSLIGKQIFNHNKTIKDCVAIMSQVRAGTKTYNSAKWTVDRNLDAIRQIIRRRICKWYFFHVFRFFPLIFCCLCLWMFLISVGLQKESLPRA